MRAASYSLTMNVSPELSGTLTEIGNGEGPDDWLGAGKVVTISVGAGNGVTVPTNAVTPILMNPEKVRNVGRLRIRPREAAPRLGGLIKMVTGTIGPGATGCPGLVGTAFATVPTTDPPPEHPATIASAPIGAPRETRAEA